MSERYKNIFKIIFASCLVFCISYCPAKADDNAIKLRGNIDETKPSIKLQGGVAITQNKQLMSLSLRDSDVKQVIRMLADKAGLNVVFAGAIDGKVTLDLVNVSINQIFDYVMTMNKLAYRLDGKTLIIATKTEATTLGLTKQQVKPIKIKYLEAGVVAKFLNKDIFGQNNTNPELTSSDIVITNPTTNEVLIFGSDKDIALAQKVISYLDVEPKMKTFKVNHIDIKTMTDMVCDVIFKTNSGTGSGGTTGGTSATTTSGTVACGTINLINGSSLESLGASSFAVMYNPGLSEITIYGGTQEQLNLAGDLIKKFDKKEPQVIIELSIVELNEAGTKALSSTWSYLNGKLRLDTGYDSTSQGGVWDGTTSLFPTTIKTATDPITGGKLINTRGGYVWTDRGGETTPDYGHVIAQNISFLLTQNKGRLLANPRLIASNNKESTINITSDYLAERTQTVTTTVAGPSTATDYSTDSAGIEITLTPKITSDGYVIIDIKPSYTVPATQIKENNNIVVTLVNTRSMDLKGIRVKDGETFVVGGLIQENETKSSQKVPVLGEIPILGALFRASSNDTARTELIIMVTPKILKDDDQVSSL